MGDWLSTNWFNLLSAVGIIGSLLFTGISLRSETKTRRISNLLTLTQNHRELWAEMFRRPGLERVLDPSANLDSLPVTLDEHFYVAMAIHHLNSAYRAIRSGLLIKPDGVGEDIRGFFSLPVPREVWRKLRSLQNEDFVAFVEACLAGSTHIA